MGPGRTSGLGGRVGSSGGWGGVEFGGVFGGVRSLVRIFWVGFVEVVRDEVGKLGTFCWKKRR